MVLCLFPALLIPLVLVADSPQAKPKPNTQHAVSTTLYGALAVSGLSIPFLSPAIPCYPPAIPLLFPFYSPAIPLHRQSQAQPGVMSCRRQLLSASAVVAGPRTEHSQLLITMRQWLFSASESFFQ